MAAAIRDAASDADVETLRRLLAEGVSPDATDFNTFIYGANTALHYLCRWEANNCAADDRVACIKLLIDAGANLEAVDLNGYTTLQFAANFANAEIVSLLVDAGANVNAVTNYGSTALHLAASDCVEVLLAAGADIDVRDNSGRGPFIEALSSDKRRAWPLFLRAGAELPAAAENPGQIWFQNPYIVRVRNAGGFKKYEQAHITRITAILAQTPHLPPEMVRKIVEFWLHAGYY